MTPLFEEHILANIIDRLKTYTLSDIFLPIFALILLTLYVLARVLRPYLAISENMLENTQALPYLPPPQHKILFTKLIYFSLNATCLHLYFVANEHRYFFKL